MGEGIQRAIKAGVCTREELFVTSKLWNTYHAPEHVEAACRKSLEDLGLDYLDLYLIHFPISLAFVPFSERYPPEWVEPGTQGLRLAKVPVQKTWGAMEALATAGLVRDIGVSNWSSQGLRDLLAFCTVKPAVLQIEAHPYLQCTKLVEYAMAEGIQVRPNRRKWRNFAVGDSIFSPGERSLLLHVRLWRYLLPQGRAGGGHRGEARCHTCSGQLLTTILFIISCNPFSI